MYNAKKNAIGEARTHAEFGETHTSWFAESNSRALLIKANFHGIAESNSCARQRFVCFVFFSAQNITSEQFKIGTQGPTIFDSLN